jgi:hypothetical protein
MNLKRPVALSGIYNTLSADTIPGKVNDEYASDDALVGFFGLDCPSTGKRRNLVDKP